LIHLREKDLAPHELINLARLAQQQCKKYDAMLLINSSIDVAAAVNAAGVHLPEHGVSSVAAGAACPSAALQSISVHSTEAARRAEEAGADFLVFGSVFPTASHPGEAPQGLEKLEQVVRVVKCPVFAVGGITAGNVAACLNCGAHGIAVISAVWGAPDVSAAVQTLIRASGPSSNS
jgi:thiamine-phosphate pyrophosphorylase